MSKYLMGQRRNFRRWKRTLPVQYTMYNGTGRFDLNIAVFRKGLLMDVRDTWHWALAVHHVRMKPYETCVLFLRWSCRYSRIYASN